MKDEGDLATGLTLAFLLLMLVIGSVVVVVQGVRMLW